MYATTRAAPRRTGLGSMFSELADLYNTPGNEVREADEQAVREAFGIEPTDPEWWAYRDALNIDADDPPESPTGGVPGDIPPHISQAPAAYQIEELVAQMGRYGGGGVAGLAMPCPSWASASVCSVARVIYSNRVNGVGPGDGEPPPYGGEGTDDPRTAPEVELGLTYPVGVNPTVLAGVGLLLLALALPTKRRG